MSVPPWETLRIESEAHNSEADTNLQLADSEEEEEEELFLYPGSIAKRPTPNITLKQDLSVGNPEFLGASKWRHGSVQQCTQQLRDALEHVFGPYMLLV
jgi:hypothetical protein